MDNATERIVLITGANRGIGFETAQQLARRGFHVVIAARGPGERTTGGRRHPVCQWTRNVPSARREQRRQYSERRQAVCGNC